MSITEENKAFLLRYAESINGKLKPEAVLDQYLDDQTLKEHILAAEAAFPLYWIDVAEVVAEGDLVSMRGQMKGVHQGDFMGIPPTGRAVDVPVFVTYRIAGGKIVDHWMLLDNLALMQQLGIIPETAG
jgi:predicted ester cyclase